MLLILVPSDFDDVNQAVVRPECEIDERIPEICPINQRTRHAKYSPEDFSRHPFLPPHLISTHLMLQLQGSESINSGWFRNGHCSTAAD
jgi:hypothetical protein